MTCFIFFDPICFQARPPAPPLPVFTSPYSSATFSTPGPLHPLLYPPPRFPLPIFLWRRGRASVALLNCVLPPGLPSNYCILSFEERNAAGRKEEQEEYSHLLLEALLLQHSSLNGRHLTTSFYEFIGLGIYIS